MPLSLPFPPESTSSSSWNPPRESQGAATCGWDEELPRQYRSECHRVFDSILCTCPMRARRQHSGVDPLPPALGTSHSFSPCDSKCIRRPRERLQRDPVSAARPSAYLGCSGGPSWQPPEDREIPRTPPESPSPPCSGDSR